MDESPNKDVTNTIHTHTYTKKKLFAGSLTLLGEALEKSMYS